MYYGFAIASLAVLSPTGADHEARVWLQGIGPRCSVGPPRGVASWSIVPLMGEAHGAAIVGALW